MIASVEGMFGDNRVVQVDPPDPGHLPKPR
jgi:hypothetical protein